MWAFKEVFSGVASLGRFGEAVRSIARDVVERWAQVHAKGPEGSSDAVTAVSLARELMAHRALDSKQHVDTLLY